MFVCVFTSSGTTGEVRPVCVCVCVLGWAGVQSPSGSASQVYNALPGSTKGTRGLEEERAYFLKIYSKSKDYFFASLKMCNSSTASGSRAGGVIHLRDD